MNKPGNPRCKPPEIFSQPPAPPTESIFLGPEGLRAGWAILLFAILFLTFGQAIHFLAVQGHQAFRHASDRTEPPTAGGAASPVAMSPTHLYTSEGLPLLAVLLTSFTLARIERRPFSAYGLAGPRRLPNFTQGLLWGLLCLSLLVATLHLTGHLPIDAVLLRIPQAIRYGAIWAVGFALVAFLEETLLRGYLQYTLTRGLRAIIPALLDTPHTDACAFWLAALILSFFFGLGHGSNPGESPIGLVSAGLAGLVFSLALYRTGSLWWALGFHTSWDWAQSFLYGVADSGASIQHRFLATHTAGAPILSGGATGPEGSLFIVPTLALAAVIILLTRSSTARTTESSNHPTSSPGFFRPWSRL